MKKALVTGIAGFIGSTLAEQLVSDGVEVVGIDAMTDYYPTAIKEDNLRGLTGAGVRVERANLLDADLDALLQGVDVVFHQAGQPGVRPSWGDHFANYSRDNVLATQCLLEAVARSGSVERLVYASSSSVYGDAERYPTTEDDRPQPMSPYGVTKLAGEHLAVLYAKNFAVPTVALRYFTVFGPRQRPDMGFTRFITRALSGREIAVYGDGTQIREFTFVDDIARANMAAAVSDVAPGTVMNVSGGASVSLIDALREIERAVGVPLDLRYQESVKGDVYRTGGDSTRAATLLGWTPQVPLAEGIQRQVEWLRPRIADFSALV